MLKGDISKKGAPAVAFNLSSVCHKVLDKRWFRESKVDIVPVDQGILGFMSRLCVRYNLYMLIDDPDLKVSTLEGWVEENYLPISKCWYVPDGDHYDLFINSIHVEATLIVHPDSNNYFNQKSRGEVLHYFKPLDGWCALVDFLEGRSL